MADRELVFEFRALTDSFRRGVQQATGILESMRARVDAVGRAVNIFTGLVVGNVLVQGIRRTFGLMSSLVSDAVLKLDTLATQAKRLGLDSESFRAVQIALEEAGVDLDHMYKLMLRADDIANKLGADLRAALGINVGRLRSGNIVQFMSELEKLRGLPLPKLREMFGRQLRHALLLMQEGFYERFVELLPHTEGLNEIANTVSKLERPLHNMSLAWERFKYKVVYALAPHIENWLNSITESLDVISLENIEHVIETAITLGQTIRLTARGVRLALREVFHDSIAYAIAWISDWFTGLDAAQQIAEDVEHARDIEVRGPAAELARKSIQQARETRRQLRTAQAETVATARTIEEWFQQISEAIYDVIEKVPHIDLHPVLQFMYDIGEVFTTIGEALFDMRSPASLIGGLNEMFRKALGVGFMTETEQVLNLFQQRMEALDSMAAEFGNNPQILAALYENVRRDALNALGLGDEFINKQQELWDKVHIAYEHGLLSIEEARMILEKNIKQGDTPKPFSIEHIEAGVAMSFEQFQSERLRSQTKFEQMVRLLQQIEINTRTDSAEPVFA